jgi:hypothetical protein
MNDAFAIESQRSYFRTCTKGNLALISRRFEMLSGRDSWAIETQITLFGLEHLADSQGSPALARSASEACGRTGWRRHRAY